MRPFSFNVINRILILCSFNITFMKFEKIFSCFSSPRLDAHLRYMEKCSICHRPALKVGVMNDLPPQAPNLLNQQSAPMHAKQNIYTYLKSYLNVHNYKVTSKQIC